MANQRLADLEQDLAGIRPMEKTTEGNNMPNHNQIYLAAAILMIASLACAVPAISIPDESAISTSAAQTVIAGLTQNAPQILFSPTLEPALEASPTVSPSFTPEPPTDTPSPTSTLTETLTPQGTITVTLSFTPTPFFSPTTEFTLIAVSVATNCRTGPGKVYPMVGALLVGETARAYARNSLGNYWYIRNPNIPSDFCWVWGEYATVLGPYMLLPVFTPPPTPTATLTPLPTITPTLSPDFKAEYAGMDTCASAWWGEAQLKNTGSTPFKSVKVSLKDKATDVVVENLADGFKDVDGCLRTTTKDVLGAGESFILSAPAFTYNPAGHNIRVTITLCSDAGQKGLCVTKSFNFKP